MLLHSRKANYYKLATSQISQYLAGDCMATKDDVIEDLLEKINSIAEEIATIKEELGALKALEKSVKGIEESKENEVIIKKIDDILSNLTESDVISKKLDDLQGYIAGDNIRFCQI